MPMIPAVCDSCGRPRPSLVKIQDATMHLAGETGGACACGGTLRLIDGTYSHLGGPINLCRAPAEDLKRFAAACRACGVAGHVDLG